MKTEKKLKLKKRQLKALKTSSDLHLLIKEDLFRTLKLDQDSSITKDLVNEVFETAEYNPVIASFMLLKELDIFLHGNAFLGIEALEQENSKVGLLGLKASVIRSLLKLYYIESGTDQGDSSSLDIVLTYENASLGEDETSLPEASDAD